MIEPARKNRRRPRSTNSRRPDIREAIARRKRLGEPLTVRTIFHETGGSFRTILEELELAGVKPGESSGVGGKSRREETLRQLLAEERKGRAVAEAEAKASREMYEEIVARLEYYLRKGEERAKTTPGGNGEAPQVLVKEIPVRDELTEARLRRLTNENARQVKKIEELLARLRKYEPDAE